MRCRLSLVAVLLAAGVVSAAEGDLIPNPPYKHWAAFKPGTTVTLKQIVREGTPNAAASPSEETEQLNAFKLLEVTPEKVVVEQISSDIENGSIVEQAPVKLIFPAKVDKKYAKGGVAREKLTSFKEGLESVKHDKGDAKCQLVESSIKNGDEESISRQWSCDDVPGGIVKEVITKKIGGKVAYETTTLLIDIKVVK